MFCDCNWIGVHVIVVCSSRLVAARDRRLTREGHIRVLITALL